MPVRVPRHHGAVPELADSVPVVRIRDQQLDGRPGIGLGVHSDHGVPEQLVDRTRRRRDDRASGRRADSNTRREHIVGDDFTELTLRKHE